MVRPDNTAFHLARVLPLIAAITDSEGLPFFSGVTSTYNGEKFIAAALESVRAQQTQGIDLVIIDDGSTGQTREIPTLSPMFCRLN